jgi:hypothetical protein
LKLQPASPATHLWCGVKIEFDVRLRKHRGADIATVHHNATSASELSLFANENGAYPWKRGHQRSPFTHGLTANSFRDVTPVDMDCELPITAREPEREACAEPNQFRFVGPRNPLFSSAQSNGAVHSTGIDVLPSEVPRQAKR